MAYITQDDKLQDGQAPNTDYPQAQGLNTGGSSTDVGSGGGGVSTAGVGAGGTGQWTNVQSYLEANKQGTGSAQALENQVGSQFDQEKNQMSQNAQSYLGDAQKQVDDQKIDDKKADELIGQAAGSYQWDGGANTDYNQTVDKVRGALTNEYKGPLSYSYGFSQPTQKYAQGLTDNSAFDGVMNDVYSKSAGKNLTRGQFDLQKQLDVSNKALANTRQKMLERYQGLEADRDKTVADTTQALGGLADQYRQNQSNLRDYLGSQANRYDTATSQAEADARAGYQNALKGQSGRGNAYWGVSGNTQLQGDLGANGVWGGNLSFDQLAKEQELERQKNLWYGGATGNRVADADWGNYGGWQNAVHNNFMGNRNALNSFYGQQDQQYANTADQEKRSYNSILDFLNSGGTKRNQGFQVRG